MKVKTANRTQNILEAMPDEEKIDTTEIFEEVDMNRASLTRKLHRLTKHSLIEEAGKRIGGCKLWRKKERADGGD